MIRSIACLYGMATRHKYIKVLVLHFLLINKNAGKNIYDLKVASHYFFS